MVDPNQCGTVLKSSTTHALISIVHNLAKATDGNETLVRLVLSDFIEKLSIIRYSLKISILWQFRLVSPLGKRFFDQSQTKDEVG